MENQNDPLLYSNGATKHVLKQTKKPPLKLLKAASLTTQLTLKTWKLRTVQAMNANSKKAWSLKLNLTTLAGTMGFPTSTFHWLCEFSSSTMVSSLNTSSSNLLFSNSALDGLAAREAQSATNLDGLE